MSPLTIVAAVMTRDCLVMGTDSLSTLLGVTPQGQPVVYKSYPHTQKLFEVHGMGIATWGTGAIGGRSIAGVVSDFGASLPSRPPTVQDLANRLDQFLNTPYSAQFPTGGGARQPELGFLVGGYSTGSAFSEVWQVLYPGAAGARVTQRIAQNGFGASWAGVSVPFLRLSTGVDPRFEAQLLQLGVSATVIQQAKQAVQGLQMQVIFDSMPVQTAIEYCRFILDVTMGSNKFEVGTALTGEPIQIAVITQRNSFRWVSELAFHT
jgi:hypothetical protein